MDKIVDHTMKYYNQEAILAYKISDEYIQPSESFTEYLQHWRVLA